MYMSMYISKLQKDNVRRNLGGGSERFSRASCVIDSGIGAKDESNNLIAGSLRCFLPEFLP